MKKLLSSILLVSVLAFVPAVSHASELDSMYATLQNLSAQLSAFISSQSAAVASAIKPVAKPIVAPKPVAPSITSIPAITDGQGSYINGKGFGKTKNDIVNVYVANQKIALRPWKGNTAQLLFTPFRHKIGPGTYPVKVEFAGLTSNAMNLVIKKSSVVVATSSPATAHVVGTPSLTLAYDSAQNESSLAGDASVEVTAGSKEDLLVYNMYMGLNNQSSQMYGFPNNTQFDFSAVSGSVKESVKDSSGNMTIVWRVKAGKTVTFKVHFKTSPNLMYPGVYSTFLAETMLVLGADKNYATLPIDGPLPVSATVTLVGESSSTVLSSSPSLVAANTSANIGMAITRNNAIVGYNVTYQFTLVNAGSADAYVSSNPMAFVNSSGLVIQSVSPSTLAGDTPGAYVIPMGASRTFTLTGVLRGFDVVSIRIAGISYGSTPTSTYTQSLTSGLENLVLTATLDSVSTATSTSNIGSVTVSNASAQNSGAIIQGNSTVGYNIAYQFSLTNTNGDDVYVSSNTAKFVSTSTTGTAGVSTLASIQTVTPSTLSGDTSSAYVIPSGATRTFTITGAIRGTTGQSGVNLKVTGINWGTISNQTAKVILSGLENLNTTANF